MVAIATLLVVVVVTLIINRVGAIALTTTGLSSEVANFQARSALTGVGFTTNETELIVSHPVRRRIVLTLMLLGNAGLVTIIGTLVVGFAGEDPNASTLLKLGLLAGGLVVILVGARSRVIDRLLTEVIAWSLKTFTQLEVRDYVQLLNLSSDYAVAELGVEADSWVAKHRLIDLQLPEEGVLVLGIQRSDGTFVGAPRGHTRIREHDTLILYGYSDVLEDLGKRKVGREGDRAHIEITTEISARQAIEDVSHPEQGQ
ncbi:MAG: potassium transporter TrkA [Actinobacteria bacterium]|nr:MAG: potassium transporter TrkA [Actinomycetota bacterium]